MLMLNMKRSTLNESSADLWHKRLGHISKERILRLIKAKFCLNWILPIGIILVWIALRVSKPNMYQNKLPQGVMDYLI